MDQTLEQPKQKQRKKLSLTTLIENKNQQNISDNGSLVLSTLRLNSQGMRFTEHGPIVCQFPINFVGSLNLKLEEFEVVQRLGQGKSGQVDLVIHKPTQEYYALKKIHYVSDDVQESLLKKELLALIESDSPHIVKCYGAFYSKGQVFILLEYMDMGSLDTIIKRCGKIVESILMMITQQILSGINYLHSVKKIIHRDIKPQNILINKKGEVKIADFGICSISNKSSQKWQTFIGTLTYMSPERMNGEEYGMDSDIWSLGIMIAECLIGRLPFEYNSKRMALIEFVMLVKKFDVDSYVKEWQCSKHTKEFVSMCLKKKPEERARAYQLLDSKAIYFTSNLNMETFKHWLDMALEEN